MLKGKKTYVIAAILFVLGGLRALGVIDETVFNTLAPLLGAGALATLRASVK